MTTGVQRAFSLSVENYIRYRPAYPPGLLAALQSKCALTSGAVIADVGCGTGLLAQLFLEGGNVVYGIEPNAAMREACEHLLNGHPMFHSVDGSAESTRLPHASVDFVICGQSFHCFDPDEARSEFLRILRPQGWAVVVWNERRTSASSFMRDYERVASTYGVDYRRMAMKFPRSATLPALYRGKYSEAAFRNQQILDFEALRGRYLSATHAPQEGHPNYEPALADLRQTFEAHEIDGKVRFEYDTRMYYARLIPAATFVW